jgi:hypothetical protein
MDKRAPWNEPHPDACPIGKGNRTGYLRGACRCDWCRWANSAYIAHHRGQVELPLSPPDRWEQLTLFQLHEMGQLCPQRELTDSEMAAEEATWD